MARYVSMGNSITAGYQSAGINDSTQQRSYAVLFASRADATFFVPVPPGTRLRARRSPTTSPRPGSVAAPPPPATSAPTSGCCYVSNVAVPGATSFSPNDNLTPYANSNALTTFILGGRTQNQAMMDADPTFVTAWIGNNDVLGALTSSTNPGNPALITPLAGVRGQLLGDARHDPDDRRRRPR